MSAATPSPILVEVPASPEHVPVLRAVVASVAARLDLPLDHIEDLKIAVDEACAHLLKSTGGSLLRLELRGWPTGIEIAASTDDSAAAWPPDGFEGSMTWHVLTALTDDASFEAEGGPTLRFLKRSGGPVGG